MRFYLLCLLIVPCLTEKLSGDEFCQENFVDNHFYYLDTDDCHSYYQCDNAGHGWNRHCANGTFWSGAVMQCVPDGEFSCKDRCIELEAAACYALDGQCNTFYRCSNRISYKFCCPAGTFFNETSCNCEESSECSDICEMPLKQSTTTRPPPLINEDGDSCIDSWGNSLQPFEGDSSKFLNSGVEFDCAPGTLFNLATCDCSIFSDGSGDMTGFEKQCLLYFPFDEDFNDRSHNKFDVTVYEPVTINKTFTATGEGAATFTRNGWLEIPGTKNFDFGDTATWCFFFNTTEEGNLVTVEESDSFPLRFRAVNGGFEATIAFSNPRSHVSLHGTFLDGVIFQHVCVVANGQFLKLYMNNLSADMKPFHGHIAMSYAPYRIGSGLVDGFVDELLICPFEMSGDQMVAHFAGDEAFLESEGIYPPNVAEGVAMF